MLLAAPLIDHFPVGLLEKGPHEELAQYSEFFSQDATGCVRRLRWVKAQLGTLCTKRTNQTDVDPPPLLALPAQSTGGTRDEAAGTQQIGSSPG